MNLEPQATPAHVVVHASRNPFEPELEILNHPLYREAPSWTRPMQVPSSAQAAYLGRIRNISEAANAKVALAITAVLDGEGRRPSSRSPDEVAARRQRQVQQLVDRGHVHFFGRKPREAIEHDFMRERLAQALATTPNIFRGSKEEVRQNALHLLRSHADTLTLERDGVYIQERALAVTVKQFLRSGNREMERAVQPLPRETDREVTEAGLRGLAQKHPAAGDYIDRNKTKQLANEALRFARREAAANKVFLVRASAETTETSEI